MSISHSLLINKDIKKLYYQRLLLKIN